MAFPSNPSIGTPYSIGSKTWYWDGSAWTLSMENTPGGGDSVEILDDLLDVDTGGPPVSSDKAYNYYIQEDPSKDDAWGRYQVNQFTKTVRFHRYDLDGNDLQQLFDFTTPKSGNVEGTKHSVTALDDSFELNSVVLSKTTDNEGLYYDFVYESQDFVNAIYNDGASKLFTFYATDFGLLSDGAILVYKQSEELWKPEAQSGGGVGGGNSITISMDPPANAAEGDIWIHELNYYMYVRQGNNWVALTGPEGGTGGGGNFANDSEIRLNNRRGVFFNTEKGKTGSIDFTLNQPQDSLFSISTQNITTVGMVPPVDSEESDLWIYEDDYTLYVRQGGQWIALTGPDQGNHNGSNRLEQPCVLNGGGPFSIFCEDEDQDGALGSMVHISPLPPELPKKGSLWYDSEHLELRVYYVTADSAPVWVSATHPAMRPNYTEPENARPITITGPTQAVGETRTGPYRAILSQEVQAGMQTVVTWGVVDQSIKVSIDADKFDKEESMFAYYKYHGFGVTYLTARVTYRGYDGNLHTATAPNYRVAVTTVAPGAPIAYNVKVIEHPEITGKLVYEIDGVMQPHLNLQRNRVYLFNQSHASNLGHPLYFYTALNRNPDGSLNDDVYVEDKYAEDLVQRYGDIVELMIPHDAPARLAYGSETDPDKGYWIYPYDADGIVFDPENPNNYPFP